MSDARQVVRRNTLSDVRGTWASPVHSGRYALYVDANSILQGLSLRGTAIHGIRGSG